MKKITAILLLLLLAAGVTACAAREEPAAPSTQLSLDMEAITASETNAKTDDVPPASDTNAVTVDEAAYTAALECVGESVEVLYAAIGQPTGGAEYAASCEDGCDEDGMLHYDGFYVWTSRNAEGETVSDVYLME